MRFSTVVEKFDGPVSTSNGCAVTPNLLNAIPNCRSTVSTTIGIQALAYFWHTLRPMDGFVGLDRNEESVGCRCRVANFCPLCTTTFEERPLSVVRSQLSSTAGKGADLEKHEVCADT